MNVWKIDIITFLQKLEDTVLKETDQPLLKGGDDRPTKAPAKIREIITKNLSAEDVGSPNYEGKNMASSEQLQEENEMLQRELGRVEDLLSATRAERDEIGIKYNALSERVSRFYYYPRYKISFVK